MSIKTRKEDHIVLSRDPNSQYTGSVFDKYKLPYEALPELALKNVDTSRAIFNKKLSQPLIIAAMTGGSDHSMQINSNIAMAAQECGVAFSVGSQRIALVLKESEDSFKIVRKLAPHAFIFANLGMVQLNYSVGINEIYKVIDLIEADALYFHLNPLQESLQPEGDTNFEGLINKLEKLISKIKVPIFVKEVGHGISGVTAQKLVDIGIKNIDTAGVGGTSWAWIEAKRRGVPDYENWFKKIGIETDESIKQVRQVLPQGGLLVASGGIRSPIDGLKAILLGANYYSAAYPFLNAALLTGPEKLIEQISLWQQALKIAMFSAGKGDLMEPGSKTSF